MSNEMREFDVVSYGAGGFTGQQAVDYLSRHLPPGVRWAIAGPHREKLEAAVAKSSGPARPRELLVADSHNPASVDAVVSRARTLLNTAGPFARYGTPVVDACVRFGTHYVDITGETPWVRELIQRYHEPARAAGTRIVPCCGFDSVPSDLGALLMARHVQQSTGSPCVEVRAYYQLHGSLNGGTVASVLTLLEQSSRSSLQDPFLLDPPTLHGQRQLRRSRDLALPRPDPDLGAWIGPFIMARTNTRVVRRSAALHSEWQEPYGPGFVYQEALKYDPPLAPAKAGLVSAGLALFGAALAQPRSRRLLTALLPKPGTGPSTDRMNKGWFTCELLAFAANGQRAHGCIHHSGDPGNRATVKFLCEAALTLLTSPTQLPGGPARGGVLTPATALGHVFADRLRRAGVSIEIGQRALDAATSGLGATPVPLPG